MDDDGKGLQKWKFGNKLMYAKCGPVMEFVKIRWNQL